MPIVEPYPRTIADVLRRRWLHLSLLLLLILALAPTAIPLRLQDQIEKADSAAAQGQYKLALDHVE